MYFNKGKTMQYKEEGAAFFPPAAPPDDFPTHGIGSMIPPRTMGIDMSLLQNGFVPMHGLGAEPSSAYLDANAAVTEVGLSKLILIGAAGAVAGFMFWRHK
jgi:hypothetical protein